MPAAAPRSPRPLTFPRVDVLGVRVDAVSSDDVLRRVGEFLSDPRPRQIATANALMILAAERHPGLARALGAADLVVPDSAGVVWAAARRGARLVQTPGVELMEKICGEAAGRGWTVYLLGAAPGVAAAAAAALQKRFPRLRVSGVDHGYFNAEEEPRVIERVAQTAPDFLFVALDTPRQDAWIHRHLGRFHAGVTMGVGGSFDVFSGRVPRAPGWMRRARLEWLFRLLREPRRAGRMAELPRFVFRVLRAPRTGPASR